jgi:predicted kinase
MTTKPLLIVFVGIPGSGKTTFSRQLAKEIHAVTINSDALRLAMWGSHDVVEAARATPEKRTELHAMTLGVMNYFVQQVLRAGVTCIFDANGNRKEDRARTVAFAHENDAIPIVIRLRTPEAVTIERMVHRNNAEDQLTFDQEKAYYIARQASDEIEEPDVSEFVIEIKGDTPFSEQLEAFTEQINMILSQR